MNRHPNERGEGSKMDRAEAIQTGVVYFQRYNYLSLSIFRQRLGSRGAHQT